MKHKLLIFAVCIIAALPSFAQFRVGVEAGLNLSHAFDTNTTKPSFNVGVTGDYSFNNHWYVDAALKLSSQPFGSNDGGYLNDPGNHSFMKYSQTPYYLTLPVRVGYKFALTNKSKLSVAVGPMIGVGLFGCETYQQYGVKLHNSDAFKGVDRFEYGANARLGFEFSKHYQIGLEYSLLHNESFDNMGVFSINVGYKF